MFNVINIDIQRIIAFLDDVDFLDMDILSNDFSIAYLTYINGFKVYSVRTVYKQIVGQDAFIKESIKYSLFLNDKNIIDPNISLIWSKLNFLVDKKSIFIDTIKSLLGNPFSPNLLTKEDIEERLEEFDVIKNNKFDMISLNSLYDFYNNSFDEDYIKHKLSNIGLII